MVSKYLTKFDIFGTTMGFNQETGQKYQSSYGGVLGIITGIMMIIFSVLFGRDFYYRTNPKIVSANHFPDDYYKINLTDLGPVIAWRYEDDDGKALDVTGVLFSLENYYHYLYNTTTNQWEIGINLYSLPKPCKDIPNLDLKFTEKFDVNSWYCLSFPEQEWGGFWDGKFAAGFSTMTDTCNLDKSVCSGQAELAQLLKGSHKNLFASFLYPQFYLDPSNIDEPLKYNYVNYYEVINLNIVKKKTFMFKEAIMDDDLGWIFESLDVKKQFTLDEIRHDVYFKPQDAYDNPQNYPNTNIYGTSFYFTKNYIYYKRTFMKIQDLAAVVGGILKAILVFFSLFMNYYNKSHSLSTIINTFFYSKETSKPDFEHGSSSSINLTQARLGGLKEDDRQIISNNRENFFKTLDDKLKEQHKGSVSGTNHLVYMAFCGKCCYRRNTKMYEKLKLMENYVNDKLTVKSFIQQTIVFDRVVDFIFNKNQQVILKMKKKFNIDDPRDRKKIEIHHDEQHLSKLLEDQKLVNTNNFVDDDNKLYDVIMNK